MIEGIGLDKALMAAQSMGQSVIEASAIIAVIVFLVWTVKLAME